MVYKFKGYWIRETDASLFREQFSLENGVIIKVLWFLLFLKFRFYLAYKNIRFTIAFSKKVCLLFLLLPLIPSSLDLLLYPSHRSSPLSVFISHVSPCPTTFLNTSWSPSHGLVSWPTPTHTLLFTHIQTFKVRIFILKSYTLLSLGHLT